MKMEESAVIDSIFRSDSPRPDEAVTVTAELLPSQPTESAGLLSNWTSATLRVQAPRQPETA